MTATHLPNGHEASDTIVHENAIRFGPEDQLVGIISHPAHKRPSAPAIVILNAGVLHRVGPHRMHVHLARRLAELGFTSLRLDLGGIGDSVASSDAPTFRESAMADTRLAMTGLAAESGAKRFVIFGICAGADNALATALSDDRVAGIVLVDPHGYPNRRSQLRALRAKVAANGGARGVMRWGLRVAERRVRAQLERLRRPAESESDPPAEGREPLPIADFRQQLTALVERGVRILAIYSGIHGARYNAPDQLFELFPELRGRVDRAYFHDANHTFTELAAQAQLLETVTTWVSTRLH